MRALSVCIDSQPSKTIIEQYNLHRYIPLHDISLFTTIKHDNVVVEMTKPLYNQQHEHIKRMSSLTHVDTTGMSAPDIDDIMTNIIYPLHYIYPKWVLTLGICLEGADCTAMGGICHRVILLD